MQRPIRPESTAWLPPVLLYGRDEIASQRNTWNAMAPSARAAAVEACVTQDNPGESWAHGIGSAAQETWARAFRLLGTDGAKALAQRESLDAFPPLPNPLTDEQARRWQSIARRWGWERIQCHPLAVSDWESCLDAMEAGWGRMVAALGIPDNALGQGRLSLMLGHQQDHSAFERLNATVHLGKASTQHSGFLHEWAHALDAWLGQSLPENGAPGRNPAPISMRQDSGAFPEVRLATWESYQGVWATWSAAWRSWSHTLPKEQGATARAWWVQAERMHRRGALSEQALRPVRLFLETLGNVPQADVFRNWLVAPTEAPKDPWTWAAEHLDPTGEPAYLSLPQERWARAVQSVIANQTGASWTHEKCDHAALFPTLSMAKIWRDHWSRCWPQWRTLWLNHARSPHIQGRHP